MTLRKIFTYLASPYTDVQQKKSTKGNNLPVLDGIRGLAVIIVLTSHTSAFYMYGQGSLGVLLFFFLSGFVLIIPYAEKPQSFFSQVESKRYFINRTFRIVPAYLAIVGAIALIQHTGYEWFLWNASFLKGWNHLWSVAEEVRFYFLLPVLLLFFALLRNKILILAFCILVMFVSYRYRNIYRIDLMDGRFVGFYFYIFAGGIFTYILTTVDILQKKLQTRCFESIFSIVSSLIFLSFMLTSSDIISTLWRPLFHHLPEGLVLNAWKIPHIWLVLFIIFFFSLTFYRNGFVLQLMQHYFFRHIGLLSYSIYLSHMVIMFKLQAAGFQGAGLFLSVFTCSYAVSIMSYLCIEKPFLLLKKKMSNTNNGSATSNATSI